MATISIIRVENPEKKAEISAHILHALPCGGDLLHRRRHSGILTRPGGGQRGRRQPRDHRLTHQSLDPVRGHDEPAPLRATGERETAVEASLPDGCLAPVQPG